MIEHYVQHPILAAEYGTRVLKGVGLGERVCWESWEGDEIKEEKGRFFRDAVVGTKKMNTSRLIFQFGVSNICCEGKGR